MSKNTRTPPQITNEMVERAIKGFKKYYRAELYPGLLPDAIRSALEAAQEGE